MVIKVPRSLVPAAVALGLLSGSVSGSLHLTAISNAQAAASRLTGTAAQVTAVGNLHGFRLAYEKANPDGSVTAVLRGRRTAIVYLGSGGSRLSVSASSKVVVVKVRGKKKHLVKRKLLVGATNPAASGSTQSRGFRTADLAATNSVINDLRGAGLSQRAMALIAAQDAAQVRHNLGATPDATSGGGVGHISSWCLDTLYGANMSAVATGCDVRTVLQVATNNNYIADDMSGKAHCASGPCDGFLAFNIHVEYTFPSDNQIVKMEPNGYHQTDCSSDTVGLTIAGLGFNYGETTCSGIMVPKGLGQASGVGGYWTGSCGNVTCYGDTPVYVEEIAEDHATADTNPDTQLWLYQQWTTSADGSGGSDGTHCPNSGC
jgi:hypothetical protein